MKNLFWAFFAILPFFSCSKERVFKQLPEGPIKHHLIAVAKTNEGIKARGFSGATPPRTEIFLEMGCKHQQIKSEQDGRFLLALNDVDQSIRMAELTFKIGDKVYQSGYRIKDLQNALSSVAKEAFLSDKEIDALSFTGNKVALLSSNATLVRTFNVDQFFILDSEAEHSILLAQTNNIPLVPRMVTVLKNFLAIPLFATHEIALVDVDKDQVVDRSKAKDAAGQVLSFNLPTPLTVRDAIDADESGTNSTAITRSIARNAEAVFALDDTHLLASFTNYYQFENDQLGTTAVVGPGIVTLMAIDQGAFKTHAHQILPYKNPQFFISKDDKTIWVVCSGAWANVGKDTLGTSDAGLVKLTISSDRKSFSMDHTIALLNFAPTQPALVGTTFIVPRSHRNEIALINESASGISPSDIKKLSYPGQDFKFTFAEHWHDDIVFLGSSQGMLVAYDVIEGALPFPFNAPIEINPEVDKRVGLRPQNLYFRHKIQKTDLKTTYPAGYNAWVLSVTHQKLYPLDFLAVFGP